MKDLLIYAVFRALCAVCHLLGRSGSAGLGCLIGLACSMLDRRRGRIMANIARGFGRARAYGIAKRYYEHLGLILVEYAQLGRIDPGGLEAWIDAAAVGRVRDATASGRGVIIMTGHVGNWELTGYALTRSGVPLNSLYRPVGNEYLDRRLRRLRERIGQRTHGKLGSMRWSLEVLRRCEMLGLLVDQDGGRAGVFAPMFGRLASTLPTAAKLARKTGAAILPTASFRLRDRRQHRLVVGPDHPRQQ